jgi:hypothetical protein
LFFSLEVTKKFSQKFWEDTLHDMIALNRKMSKDRQQSLANPSISTDTQKPHLRQHDQKLLTV